MSTAGFTQIESGELDTSSARLPEIGLALGRIGRAGDGGDSRDSL
jgi:hypothetical protein